tara:strand:- start:1921 stop:2271 length:351 start_codon:yes stop_codon:yes gene_type:complete
MSQKGTHTDPAEFIGDLDAGVFAEKLGRALSDVALGTVENSKDGSVTVTFKVKRIAESNQVDVSHKIHSKSATLRGFAQEEDTTRTPMHVGRGGRMTLSPENQGDFFPRPARETSE